MFADLQARRFGGDWIELAANRIGRLGLEIETVMLR